MSIISQKYNIVVVCGHFMPEMGYYEVHIVEALAKLGHSVRVVTSNKQNIKNQKGIVYQIGSQNHKHGYEIIRLKSHFRIGATVVSKGVVDAVTEFYPQLVLVLGIAKLFPHPIFKYNSHSYKLVSFFGENKEFYVWRGIRSSLKSAIKVLTREILKKPFYTRAIKKSDQIYLYTPDTLHFLKQLIRRRTISNLLEKKSKETSLGFSTQNFFFDNESREKIRKKENISSDCAVLLTVTRYSKSKSLEFIVQRIKELVVKGYNIRYWIIGFDSEESINSFREYCEEIGASEYVKCFSFMPYALLREYQCAADFGLWCQVTISIQQAMGSGLPVLLEQKESVSHLIRNNNGLFFSKKNLVQVIGKAVENNEWRKPENRRRIEQFNRQFFSYENLVDKITGEL